MKKIAYDTVRLQEVEILGEVFSGGQLLRVKPTRPMENAEYEQWARQLVEKPREYKPGEVIRDFNGCTVRVSNSPRPLVIADDGGDLICISDHQIRPLIEALEEYAEVKGL